MRYTIYSKTKIDNAVFKAFNGIRDDVNPDYVFSFGGDGTMLGAIHKYIDKITTIKFIGINLGNLGFYTDFIIQEMAIIFDLLNEKRYNITEFNLLEYRLMNSVKTKLGYALNEVAITNPINTQIIDVYIDDEHFETFRGTGLLVATASGSTAYNKSLGGSVIDPAIEAMELTEIAAINNRVYKTLSSSLILPKEKRIILKSHDFENIYISADSYHDQIEDIKTIVISLSDYKVKLITKGQNEFYKRVKRAFLE